MFNLDFKVSTLVCFALFHALVIASSNYLVQIPFEIFGFHTTWGAFTFPFIFLATDLTVRLYGASSARRIVLAGLIPALIISWFFADPRIALASAAAYGVGQFLDIIVFNKLRQLKTWWTAPACSSIFGSAIDTFVFFSIAFYASSDVFMAHHWPEIAAVDYLVKIIIALLIFLPMYGTLLNAITKRIKVK